ncbi:MAG: FtsX-like permease family protein [Nocardioidaceae bacterium]
MQRSRFSRALTWRRVPSLAAAATVALVVGAAVLAPSVTASASVAVVRDRVAAQPPAAAGLTWVGSPAKAGSQGLQRAIVALRTFPGQTSPLLGRPVLGAVATARLSGSPVLLAWRDDECDHVVIVGRCPTSRDDVLVPAAQAQRHGWKAGTKLTVTTPAVASTDVATATRTLTVVGTWRAANVADPYWFDEQRWTSGALVPFSGGCGESRTLPVTVAGGSVLLVGRAGLDGLTGVGLLADSRPVPGIGPSQAPALVAADATAQRRSAESAYLTDSVCAQVVSGNSTNTLVPPILAAGSRLRDLGAAIAFDLALVGLAGFVGLSVVTLARRRSELALARLRGVRGVRLWGFALAEPSGTLVIGTAAGTGLGLLGSDAFVRWWLPTGTPLLVPSLAWTLVGVVVLAGVAGMVAAVVPALRQPLAAQLRGPLRPAGATAARLVAETLVIAAAAAAFVLVVDDPAVGDGPFSLAAPAVVALAAGVVAVLVLEGVSRAWLRLARWRPPLSGFLGVSRVARTRDGAAVAALVVPAVVLVVVATSASAGAVAWRAAQAHRAVGAAVQIRSVLPVTATLLATRYADPTGRWLAAATSIGRGAAAGRPAVSRVFVDMAGWARVVQPELSADAGVSSAAAAKLSEGNPIGLVVRGSVITAQVDAGTAGGRSVRIALDLVAARGGALTQAVLRPGKATRTTKAPKAATTPARAEGATGLKAVETATATEVGTHIPVCRSGCWVRRIIVLAADGFGQPPAGVVRLSDLRVDGTPVPWDVAGGWRPSVAAGQLSGTNPVTSARQTTGGLDISVGSSGSLPAAIVSAAAPPVRPVLESGDSAVQSASGGSYIVGLDGNNTAVRVVAHVSDLPLGGADAVVGDLPSFLAEAAFLPHGALTVVLARADTPVSVLDDLARSGIDPSAATTLADAGAARSADPYTAGLHLYLLICLVTALVALLVAAALLALQVRARVREAASLRVVGVPASTVRRALLVEVALVLAVSVAVAAPAAVACVVWLVPHLPLVEPTGADPAFAPGMSWSVVAYLAGLMALVAVLAALVLRPVPDRARPAVLREEVA